MIYDYCAAIIFIALPFLCVAIFIAIRKAVISERILSELKGQIGNSNANGKSPMPASHESRIDDLERVAQGLSTTLDHIFVKLLNSDTDGARKRLVEDQDISPQEREVAMEIIDRIAKRDGY